MHFADSIVIFVLALILFGPKKLPEIAKQIGKLMVEFRRASNEFKAQIDEELRTMEQQERQKKLEEAAALTASTSAKQPSILPPSTGDVVSTSYPFGAVTPPELPADATPMDAAVENHAVEAPFVADASAATNGNAANGHAAAVTPEPENEQAPIHHG
jgi:sec-independent protein translocase protein TatB